MAKGIYLGVSGVARKCKRAYIGISGVARKIKKMYIGIAGVARLFFSADPVYKGVTTTLTTSTSGLAGAALSSYVFFAGGINSDVVSSVNAYSANLTKSSPTDLQIARCFLAGASNSAYALFAGGYKTYESGNYKRTNVIDAYNSSLVVNTTLTLNGSMALIAAASTPTYAMFFGGSTSSSRSDDLCAYSNSLTRTVVDTAYYMDTGAGASNSTYAMFVGGESDEDTAVISTSAQTIAFDSNLTFYDPANLSYARRIPAGTNAGEYIFFAGGSTSTSWTYSGATAIVDVFDKNLTYVATLALSSARTALAGANIDDYAIFAGGYATGTGYSYSADVFDTNLTLYKTLTMTYNHNILAGASIGDYALFAGGQSSTSGSIQVEVFEI